MSSYSVPSGHGYMDIPLDSAQSKPLKSIQAYQMDDSLNVDLEFDDDSRLEMIFRIGFHTSAKLLDCHEGDYRVRRKLKPKRSTE
jgi:hypothetical protein